jgi:hypothetical protein
MKNIAKPVSGALLSSSLLLTALMGSPAQAQKPTYRCDNNHYTDSLSDPKAQGCKLMEGGNVTVVQGLKPQAANPAQQPVKVAAASQSAGQPSQRVDAGEQRARDSDSKQIFESELRKSEARLAELQSEYNNGEPEKRGDETRNYQKYVDRVASLKEAIARVESDMAGIRRELGRVGAVGASR